MKYIKLAEFKLKSYHVLPLKKMLVIKQTISFLILSNQLNLIPKINVSLLLFWYFIEYSFTVLKNNAYDYNIIFLYDILVLCMKQCWRAGSRAFLEEAGGEAGAGKVN